MQRKRERNGSIRPGNRERIVAASLDLFNERGTRAVTTNHIAAHLSISPGNLYYHFANREEIIRAIYPQAAAAVRQTLPVTRRQTVTAADMGGYHLAGIETLWRFRFFFRDLDDLLPRDPDLRVSFRKLQRWLVGQFRILIERLIEQGCMRRPEPPEDVGRLATNAFLLWTNWIRYLANSRATIDVTRRDVVEGALHGFLVFSPYLEPRFAEEVRAVFDARPRRRREGALPRVGSRRSSQR